MHGNVWQWVQDCYHEDYKDATADGSALETGQCGGRVLRGGAWDFDPGKLRAAQRFGFTPADRSFDLGFRLTRRLTP